MSNELTQTVEVIGVEALAKLIDALTSNNYRNQLLICTDSHQAYKPGDKRAFIVEIGEKFIPTDDY